MPRGAVALDAGRHRTGAGRVPARRTAGRRPAGTAPRAAGHVADGARHALRYGSCWPGCRPRRRGRCATTGCPSRRSPPRCATSGRAGPVRRRGDDVPAPLRAGGRPAARGPASRTSPPSWRAELAARHARHLISADGTSTDELLARALLDRGWTVATGESCTGGMLASRLVDRAGSSAYVAGGVVAYSNEAKTALLDVPADMIATHGAVSPEVARALADGARARFGADVGVGITGVAGPGRRHGGQAGRLRVPLRHDGRRRSAGPRRPAARRARRHPGALDGPRDAPAAARSRRPRRATARADHAGTISPAVPLRAASGKPLSRHLVA